MKRTMMVSLLTLLALILAACSPAPATPPASAVPTTGPTAYPGPVSADPGTSGNYPAPSGGQQPAYPTGGEQGAFILVKPDGSQVSVKMGDLAGLSQTDVIFEEIPLKGPLLSDVLAALGVTDYAQVVVTGENGSVVLSKEQVTGQVLGLAGSAANLARPDGPAEQQVRVISKIEVK